MMAVSGASAGEADVIAAKAVLQQEGTYRFDVTVSHADSGWEHYADASPAPQPWVVSIQGMGKE